MEKHLARPSASRDPWSRSVRPAAPNTPQPSGAHSERGLIMMGLLATLLVVTMLVGLVMFTAGRETALSGTRYTGTRTLYVAEGGAVAGRVALMAFTNSYPGGTATVDPTLTSSTMSGWFAGGQSSLQNPLAVLDYLVVDGQQFAFGATPSTTQETFWVNWGLSTAHLKFQAAGTPVNTLGTGTYTASVVLQPNPTTDPANNSCFPAGSACAMHQLGPTSYEFFYTYTATSDGIVGPFARRRVILSKSFSVQVQLQTFATYALFTDTHTSPTGGAVWFTSNTSFNGPVHTNGEFRFAFFPTFTGSMESVSPNAWFNNTGTPVELANNENVSSGTRIDAPLVPPNSNPQAAAAAAFTRGAPTIAMPSMPYNQQGVSIGLAPGNSAQITTNQIAAAVPELSGASSIPNGIYVPVVDTTGNCSSDTGKPMGGGIYVQGALDSLTTSVSGMTAVYTLTQGSTTTTVTVDRTANTTTVNSNGWLPPSTGPGCLPAVPGPATRVFTGTPKGYQGPGNANAAVVYVEGAINSLSGTLQQNEQATIAASGNITIQGNLQYQNPPNPSDPNSNPLNLLGLYSSGGDIVIGASAPNNVIVQAVLMAGSSGSAYNSSVNVANYNSGSPRGAVNLLGGIVEKYYGPFGTFNPSTGVQLTGYSRAFTYDTRMSRGFAPPYFPTTNQWTVFQGSQPLTGARPAWREATPP